nr:hypothetical protein CFP56_36282 [Quercus suber]
MITLKAISNETEDTEGCDDPEAIKLMIHFFYHFDYTGPIIEYMDDKPAKSPKKKARSMWSDFDDFAPKPNKSDCSTTTHAKVFAAAVKYQIPALRALATGKFQIAAQKAWNNDEFCEAVQIVYETTPEVCRELRDVVADTIMAHRTLLEKPEMTAVILSIDRLAYELLKECLGRCASLPES